MRLLVSVVNIGTYGIALKANTSSIAQKAVDAPLFLKKKNLQHALVAMSVSSSENTCFLGS